MKIKYLYNSFKNANKQKTLSSYLFYLQLKSISKEFIKGEVIKQIQEHFDYSPATISLQLKNCVKLGYITVYKHESNKEWKYCLASYRKVWNKLKFRFNGQYIERFKFEFIEMPKEKSALKALLFSLELKRNKEKQIYKSQRQVKPQLEKIERQLEYHNSTIDKIKSEKVKERKKAALVQLNIVKQSLNEVSLDGDERPIENKISCKKAATLMGYKTAMMSINLSKKATEMQLLIRKSTKTLVATGISRLEFSYNPIFEKCLWLYGKVFKQECSTFSFL